MLPVPGAPHISAEKWCGRTLLLRVPRGTVAGEIRLVDFLRFARLEIFIKARPFGLYAFFRLATIQQIAARRHIRCAVRQSLDDVPCQVARARQYRLHELTWNPPMFDVLFGEDKETVGPGRQPTLDGENIPQVQLASIAYRHRGWEFGPFPRPTQCFERHLRFRLRMLNRSCK